MDEEYVIKTLHDMLAKIPLEKFDKFLIEFIEEIKAAKLAYELLDSIGKNFTNNYEMTWIDDDKNISKIEVAEAVNV